MSFLLEQQQVIQYVLLVIAFVALITFLRPLIIWYTKQDKLLDKVSKLNQEVEKNTQQILLLQQIIEQQALNHKSPLPHNRFEAATPPISSPVNKSTKQTSSNSQEQAKQTIRKEPSLNFSAL